MDAEKIVEKYIVIPIRKKIIAKGCTSMKIFIHKIEKFH